MTETVTLTPASSTPDNTTLAASFTATYGPASASLTATAMVNLVVRSAQVVAIQQAAERGERTGEQPDRRQPHGPRRYGWCSSRPTRPTPRRSTRSSSCSATSARCSRPIPRWRRSAASSSPWRRTPDSGDVTDLLSQTTPFFTSLSGVLNQEADQQFTATLTPNEVDLMPGQGQTFSLQLTSASPDPRP